MIANKVNKFYLLFLFIYLFCIKFSSLDNDVPIDPEKKDFYEKEQYLDYNLCKCDNLRPKLHSNFGVGLKEAEIDGITFIKNELTYVGTVFLRTNQYEGHAQSLNTFVPLCRGILLNSNWALSTASCVKTFDRSYFDSPDEDNYEFVVASNHNISEYYKEFDKLNLEIISAKIHEEYNSETGRANIALLELDSVHPFKFGIHSEYGINLLPGCLQDEVNLNLNSLYPENTFYTIVNGLTEKYKREYNFNRTTDLTGSPLVAENPQPKFIKVSVRELKPGGDPHCPNGYFCADSKYKEKFCPSDNGFPLMIYNHKNFRLELIGLNDAPLNNISVDRGTVTGDNECREYEPNKPITFIEIYPYLNWILSFTKKLCLTPELIRKKHELCACKNHDFGVKGRIKGGGIKSRVIEGDWVKPGDFEYVGYFSGSKNHYGYKDYTVIMFCTTVLLNRKFSLTTANCIHDKEKMRDEWVLFVVVGGTHIKSQLEGDSRHWRYIKNFYPHPNFKNLDRPTMFHENDIGLIEHLTPFDYGDDGDPPLFIHPACLQDHDPFMIGRDVKETFKFSYGLGYGHIEPLYHTLEFHNDWRMLDDFKEKYIDGSSNILKRAYLKYHGRGDDGCQKKYKDKPIFCFTKGRGKVCKNLDLGGPLVRLEVRNNKFYVSGIAFSQDSNKHNSTHWHPCVDSARMRYVDVYHYLEFITSVVGYDLCWTNGPYLLAFNSV